MSYFVHDVCTAAGVKLLSFDAYHLRMIASSRKKTDTRDSYWLTKVLQAGMTMKFFQRKPSNPLRDVILTDGRITGCECEGDRVRLEFVAAQKDGA